MNPTILVTGAAGFIGMLVCSRLLREGHRVIGLDSLNDYYSPALKRHRIDRLIQQRDFQFERIDIAEPQAVTKVFEQTHPTRVVHLAAQAGVRYALEHPYAYSASNLAGTTVILENCRRHAVEHLVLASSSSVYGGSSKVPFAENDPVDHPVSFYAATKRATELMAHSFAHLFALPVTVLRYFTVYGPWGRPDMAIWKFTDAILRHRPIEVFGGGTLSRDFTFGEDAAEATVRVLAQPPARAGSNDPRNWSADSPATSWAPFEIYNVGRSDPVSVNQLVALLEKAIGKPAQRVESPMQPGDVERTFADTRKLKRAIDYEPATTLDAGLGRFVEWYRSYRQAM